MVRKHLILIAGHLAKMCGYPSTVNRNNSNHCPTCHHVKQSMCNMMLLTVQFVLSSISLQTISSARHLTGPKTIISLGTAQFQAHINKNHTSEYFNPC
jgi:hypothetical protein